MQIDWDVGIPMDDRRALRADIYRPAEGQHPVLLSYGPYAKGLLFQVGYPDQWNRMVTAHPDVSRGSSNRYQNWEVVDPEKWVPEGYVCVGLILEEPEGPRESSILFLLGRPAICMNASNGPLFSRGRVDGWA